MHQFQWLWLPAWILGIGLWVSDFLSDISAAQLIVDINDKTEPSTVLWIFNGCLSVFFTALLLTFNPTPDLVTKKWLMFTLCCPVVAFPSMPWLCLGSEFFGGCAEMCASCTAPFNDCIGDCCACCQPDDDHDHVTYYDVDHNKGFRGMISNALELAFGYKSMSDVPREREYGYNSIFIFNCLHYLLWQYPVRVLLLLEVYLVVRMKDFSDSLRILVIFFLVWSTICKFCITFLCLILEGIATMVLYSAWKGEHDSMDGATVIAGIIGFDALTFLAQLALSYYYTWKVVDHVLSHDSYPDFDLDEGGIRMAYFILAVTAKCLHCCI